MPDVSLIYTVYIIDVANQCLKYDFKLCVYLLIELGY